MELFGSIRCLTDKHLTPGIRRRGSLEERGPTVLQLLQNGASREIAKGSRCSYVRGADSFSWGFAQPSPSSSRKPHRHAPRDGIRRWSTSIRMENPVHASQVRARILLTRIPGGIRCGGRARLTYEEYQEVGEGSVESRVCASLSRLPAVGTPSPRASRFATAGGRARETAQSEKGLDPGKAGVARTTAGRYAHAALARQNARKARPRRKSSRRFRVGRARVAHRGGGGTRAFPRGFPRFRPASRSPKRTAPPSSMQSIASTKNT